jgi:AcrR family transcriptional regulator
VATLPDPADRIRDAAVRLFNDRGYGSATIEAIAHAARVGVGTIYRRWPDKPALANEVFAWVETSIYDTVVAPPLTTRSPKQQFLELWHRMWDYGVRHPERIVFIEGHSHEAFVNASNRELKRKVVDIAADLLRRAGILAPADVAVSMITGTLVHLIRSGTEADPADLGERLWRALRA